MMCSRIKICCASIFPPFGQAGRLDSSNFHANNPDDVYFSGGLLHMLQNDGIMEMEFDAQIIFVNFPYREYQ